MSNMWERAQSIVVTIAAMAIAGVVAHREFAPAPPASGTARRSEAVPAWREVLQAGHVAGNPNAKVKIIEFADLECPFCSRFNATLKDVAARYPKDVAIVFVHFPLGMHRFARSAARVAECGDREGRFFALVDALYQKQDSFGLRPWSSYARDAGIHDTISFLQCAADTAALPAIARGEAAAHKLNVMGTPSILLNDWHFGSTPTQPQLVRAIDDVLAGRSSYRR